MDINPKRKLAVLMLGLTGLTGVGVALSGVASAQSTRPKDATAIEQTVPEGAEAPEASEGVEAPGEPSDAELAASGITPHADAVGQNVDHQFEGVE
jgi:hypothetical protein